MLCEITIENVAVIEKATATFAEGFTVLTGETGAGKSIMIDSINAILGNRTSRDIVRSGAAKASIWASFQDVPPATIAHLAEAGYECDGELLLQREINIDGKSTCRINGAPATAATLREVCGGLVNIHGQHDNQSLMNPARHIDVLDAFAKNKDLLARYTIAYDRLSALDREIRGLSMSEAEKQRKLDMLRYEVAEIEDAEVAADEEDLLLEQREKVRNSQSIMQALAGAYQALSGDEDTAGAAVLLADAAREMTGAAAHAPELAHFADSLSEIYYNISEMASDISGCIADFDFSEKSLESLEERLDVLYRLKQKYGPTLEDVLAYGERAHNELDEIEFAGERLEKLTRQRAQAAAEVQELADSLTESRRDAFDKLNKETADALAFLNMPGIQMALHETRVEPGLTGQDEMEFYLSTNPGEAPKAMAKVASGGELARIMLALKSALADRDDMPTVIYDEIDTGISGMAAGRVGQLLRDTAAGGRQVICVTHTAQIAAFAQRHLLIKKEVSQGRTFTHIRELDEEGSIQELARIISGDKVTDTSLANAREMRQMAVTE